MKFCLFFSPIVSSESHVSTKVSLFFKPFPVDTLVKTHSSHTDLFVDFFFFSQLHLKNELSQVNKEGKLSGKCFYFTLVFQVSLSSNY